jgi:hypothetical protein
MGRNKSMEKMENLNKYEGPTLKKNHNNIPIPNKNNLNSNKN